MTKALTVVKRGDPLFDTFCEHYEAVPLLYETTWNTDRSGDDEGEHRVSLGCHAVKVLSQEGKVLYSGGFVMSMTGFNEDGTPKFEVDVIANQEGGKRIP